jgi:hypothetical protein
MARLGCLPEPKPAWVITMSSAGETASFYRQFHFQLIDAYTHPVGALLDCYVTRLFRDGWLSCRTFLEKNGIPVGGADMLVPARTKPSSDRLYTSRS